jgi:hypothetical protein
MKKTTLLAVALVSITPATTNVNAQTHSPRFMTAMEANLKILDTASAPATFLMLASNFERIAKADSMHWEPYYHAAHNYAVLAAEGNDISRIDELTDKALTLLEKAEMLKPGNSEIAALFAMITNIRILVDPIGRYMEYNARATEYLHTARLADPSNPRPYFIEARTLLHVPVAMGGGPQAALPLLEEALKKYKMFAPENSIAPRWGQSQTQELAEKIKRDKF